ncbi:Oligopeptidase A [Tritrichomonas foetus]|uniref:oligopeptidase A n=1 Tax=Tritrichomonas foetus TaxID=1144522 RepID=A0A1J4J2P6_9EUKA|nr:Oligopeptidase A [Tritrichomonas foetus]|eukprot:OHS93650.1 Oligopeptidase A [Tritrichomonas foetus]
MVKVKQMGDYHPFLDPSLKFRWAELTPEQAQIDIVLAIERCQKKIDELVNISDDEISYETTFQVYDEMFSELSQAWALFTHLNSVRDSASQRSAFKILNPKYVDFSTSVDLNPKLWELFQKSEKIVKSDPKKFKLDAVKLRYIEKTIRGFKRHGADLDEKGKEEISAITKELAEVTDKYKKNQLDSRVNFEFFVEKGEEHLLESLPETAISMLTEKTNGERYRFTLEAPLSSLVMKYAKNEEIRKKMWEGTCSIGFKGEFDNTENVHKILELRDRKAKILGYKSFADYMTEIRMMKNGDKALKFVDDLRDMCFQKYLEENETIRKYKAKLINTTENQDLNENKNNDENKNCEECEVMPWERAYYSELLRKEKYDFDDEVLRPYFSVENVMKGVFQVTATIYGINVVEKETFYRENKTEEIQEDAIEVWHKDVKYYEVYDKDTKELLGAFYADWHPREDKRSGAWEKQLVSMSTNLPRNIATLNGNLAKSTSGKPALLTRREAQTIFHEFGHLCHFLLSKSPIRSLAGTHVLRDFVEFPSRFLENWTWNRESLDLFAHHYETGERIPDELFNKMIAARNFHSASLLMGQLRISKVDMELHHHFEKYSQIHDIDEIDDLLLSEYRDPKSSKIRSPSLIYNSRHLFASPVGYSADYYSYKWAEVLEADVFARFNQEGVMNPKLGREIREKIISQGDMKPPDELFRDFMGRDPDPSAFFQRYGLL